MAYQTIQDREVNVSMKLGNRADLNQPAPGSGVSWSRIDGWLRDAYISIAMSNSMEQSEQTIKFVTVPNQDTYSYPTTVRSIKSLVGYNPQNGAPIIVEWKDMNYIRRYTNPVNQVGQPTLGPPTLVAAWNNTLVFRPYPDLAYNFVMDCWMNPAITSDVKSTQLLIPDDWLEVLDYEAAVRGHTELLERDKAREIQTLLYGFVDPATGKFTQGIVDKLGNRRQAQAPYIDYGLQPQWRGGFMRRSR